MHVAFIVAEMSPLVKVGGLADVAGALPAALAAEGARVSILLPAYRSIDVEKHGIRQRAAGLSVPMGPESRGFSVLEAADTPPGVRLYLIEQETYFGRDGVYVDPRTKEEYPDTAERFTFFTRAALEALRALGDRVDVVHCHDHQTALAPAHLKIHYRDDPVLGAAASVYTLHNLGYQGIHPPEILDLAGFGRGQCYPGSYFEYYGKVNFMKVGICFADKVSTVSEKYAREICRDEVQSAGLAPVIQTRAQDLVGIINGIDEEEWNPAKDPHLPRGFDAEDLGGKRECKSALLKVAGLDPAGLDRPLLGMVSRLVEQKGLDLVEEAFPEILERGVYFVVLGTGIPRYEKFFRDAAAENPGKVAALIKFDNSLAHLAEAGLDLFLMPSLYEPCGLNQCYSRRNGTVPVGRATGGLADTVSDADSGAEGVGFTFREYRARDLLEALDRALEAYRDPRRWRAIQRRGMARDSSWTASARKYLSLYRQAVESRTAG
ncbi:MAG: glycogen synthase [Planctomycetota bacterium]|nr:glycogen synthase [Planctomycetota bacterium]